MSKQVVTTDQGEVDAVIELYLGEASGGSMFRRETSMGLVTVYISEHGIVHISTDTVCDDVMIVPSELMCGVRALSEATG